MTPEELIAEVSPPLYGLGAGFYFAPATLARGKELGLDGFRFYFAGRGGVLGDVEPAVVGSAFGYFHPALVEKIWSSAVAKVPPRDAARSYNEACREHGRATLAAVDGLGGFCDAAATVIGSTHNAGLALYAGWAAEPLPDDLPGRAMQLAAVLRELRGSVHLLAVVTKGLTPEKAHFMKRPDDYANFGYAEDAPDITAADRAAHVAAEQLTDELMVAHYAVLDDAGRDALAAGVASMQAAGQG